VPQVRLDMLRSQEECRVAEVLRMIKRMVKIPSSFAMVGVIGMIVGWRIAASAEPVVVVNERLARTRNAN